MAIYNQISAKLMDNIEQAAIANRAVSKEQAFTEIANEHLDNIYSYARYFILDADEADDIVQKTFLSLYNNLEKLDLTKPVKPWLFKVARNHCLDYLKKRKALHFSEVEEQIEAIPENSESIENQLDSQMFTDKVKECVRQLPVNIKEVMLLKYFEDMTFEQIAYALNMPVNTAKSYYYRGKVKLFQMIEQLQN